MTLLSLAASHGEDTALEAPVALLRDHPSLINRAGQQAEFQQLWGWMQDA